MDASVDPQVVPALVPALFLFSRPPSAANRPTSRAPSVHFTILVRRTDTRTPPAPRAATAGLSQYAAPPRPLTARRAFATTMPSQGNAGLNRHLLYTRGPPSDGEGPEWDSEENMEMGDNSGQAPSTPTTATALAVDLTIPPPLRCLAPPTSSATQPMGGPAPLPPIRPIRFVLEMNKSPPTCRRAKRQA